ncbi:hypothetical protein AB4527_06785 [Vibrio breoganii]
MTYDQVTEHSVKLENWMPTKELAEHFPQFTQQQIKRLFWQREDKAGLSRCYKQIGKRGYVNVPLFGMWMAGQLPEQQEATNA